MTKATKKEVLNLLDRAQNLLGHAEDHLAEQGYPGIARLTGYACGYASAARIVYKIANLDNRSLHEKEQGDE